LGRIPREPLDAADGGVGVGVQLDHCYFSGGDKRLRQYYRRRFREKMRAAAVRHTAATGDGREVNEKE